MKLAVTITAIDPPFDATDGVRFGLQPKRGTVEHSGAHRTTSFHTELDLRAEGTSFDFAGAHVHGRRGDRFLYVSWGVPDSDGPFVMFARAKVKLNSIDNALLDRIGDDIIMVAEFQATNLAGQPASGTVAASDIHWA
ncbi:MAG: DUF5990 family protein [Ilumatobacter sp.]